MPPHNGPITTGTPTLYIKRGPLGVIGAGSITTSFSPARANSIAILRILACVEKCIAWSTSKPRIRWGRILL